MPIQHKDVTGQRFGRLVALYPTGELDPKRSPIWHVKCDCGKEIDIPYSRLSRQISCGCSRIKNDLTGKSFGRLIALERIVKEDKLVYYRCSCACGNETVVRMSSLVNGITNSCGCIRQEVTESRVKDITGQTFGRLTVLERQGSNYRCICECGNEVVVPRERLVRGKAKSCGCLRREVAAVQGKRESKRRISPLDRLSSSDGE